MSDNVLLSNAYPELAMLDDGAWRHAISDAKRIEMKTGEVVLESQSWAKDFKLLISGSVRAYQASTDGREITLYRVESGGLCALSLNTALCEYAHDIVVEAETDVVMLCINKNDFDRVMRESDIFRNYVLSHLNLHIINLISMIQDTTFNPLALRLACFLGRLFEREQTNTLNITHQIIARELGSTREVISRLLKGFERQGCISLARGCIKLTSQEALANYMAVSN